MFQKKYRLLQYTTVDN